jgi:molybdate transport system ATP-binding protein
MSFEVDIVLERGTREIAVRFAAGAGITALVGPSGQGKTSTLDAVAGLRPRAGRIVVGGVTLFDAAAGVNLRPRRARRAMSFRTCGCFRI